MPLSERTRRRTRTDLRMAATAGESASRRNADATDGNEEQTAAEPPR